MLKKRECKACGKLISSSKEICMVCDDQTEKEPRKIIQFQLTHSQDEVVALCNDGTMWVSAGMEWERAPAIPQGDEDEL